MRNADQQSRFDSELIRLAYAMVAEPHTQHLLVNAIDESISHIYDEEKAECDQSIAKTFGDVAIHFDHAHSLLERQGRRFDIGAASIKLISADPSPVALIDDQGIIRLANEAGKQEHGWLENRKLDKACFSGDSYDRFIDGLRQLDRYDINKSVCVVTIQENMSSTPHAYVMTKTQDVNGHNLARLSTVNLTWLPDLGFHFAEEFKLTPIELQIVRAIVTSQPLRDLAKERGRSIGTLRNQLKGLLAKLKLSSQTELVCLYSGYVKLTRSRGHDLYTHSFRSTAWRRQKCFIATDGYQIDYSEVGPSTGRPIIFFHDFIHGTAIDEQTRQQLLKRNIRLIMPLLPGCGGTDLTPTEAHAPHEFAHYCAQMLDSLGVDQFQIIGKSVGMVVAMHLANLAQDRATGVIGLSPTVPLINKDYFNMMSRKQRPLFYVAKHIPWAMRLIVRTMLAKCDSGYDEEFITEHFSDCPPDLKVMRCENMKLLARQGYTTIYTGGVEGAVRALNSVGRNWLPMFSGYKGPIDLISGAQDGEFNPRILSDFAARFDNIKVHDFQQSGYFVLEQNHQLCFDIIDNQAVISS